MTYGIVVSVIAPVDVYDALHQELLRRTGGQIEGLLVHIARVTDDGFQVIEAWESQEAFDRANREVLWPLSAEMFGDQPAGAEPASEEFDVRGLVVPGSQIAV